MSSLAQIDVGFAQITGEAVVWPGDTGFNFESFESAYNQQCGSKFTAHFEGSVSAATGANGCSAVNDGERRTAAAAVDSVNVEYFDLKSFKDGSKSRLGGTPYKGDIGIEPFKGPYGWNVEGACSVGGGADKAASDMHVENKPYTSFGICGAMPLDFLSQELRSSLECAGEPCELTSFHAIHLVPPVLFQDHDIFLPLISPEMIPEECNDDMMQRYA
jgi:hypothetical protein